VNKRLIAQETSKCRLKYKVPAENLLLQDCELVCPKCTKAHIRAALVQKNFVGSLALTIRRAITQKLFTEPCFPDSPASQFQNLDSTTNAPLDDDVTTLNSNYNNLEIKGVPKLATLPKLPSFTLHVSPSVDHTQGRPLHVKLGTRCAMGKVRGAGKPKKLPT
jgi:hypothetical protein